MREYLRQFVHFRRSAQLFLASMFLANVGYSVSMLLLNFYLRARGYNDQFVGSMNALPSLANALVSLPIGFFADRVGRREGLLIGVSVMVTGYTGVALCNGGNQLLLWGIVSGCGTAALWAISPAFMMEYSTPAQRTFLFSVESAMVTVTGFFGYLVGGWMPRLFGGRQDDAQALRWSLVGAAGFVALALLPLVGISHRRDANSVPASDNPADCKEPWWKVSRPSLFAKLLAPVLAISLGAGLTIPFLNIYVAGKFGISLGLVGVFFAWSALATTVAILVQPWLARRFGKIQSNILVQGSSIPFLLVLGFSPVFWPVAIAVFVRGALMNMGSPIYSAFCMEQVTRGERATLAGLSTMAWGLGWAGGSWFSGWLRQQPGFDNGFAILFAVMTVLYLTSIGLISLFFLPRREARRAQPAVGE